MIFLETQMEIPKWIKLSKRDQEMAEQFGGTDTNDYLSSDNLPYCDKGGHKESSIFNQPNHVNHWRKVAHVQRNHHIKDEA